MIGLSGAHRTGKTTLCKAFSEKTGIPYVPFETGHIIKSLNFDPAAGYDFEKRMIIQEALMDEAEKFFRENSGEAVTDRTPVDILAYTLGESDRGSITEDLSDRYDNLVSHGYFILNRYIDGVFVLRPGIPYVDEEGKPPLNQVFQRLVDVLVVNIAQTPEIQTPTFQIDENVLDLDKRCVALAMGIKTIIQNPPNKCDSLLN